MLSLKKGAMFGLDARIALAIFGALSVISGAALYSAIKKSKETVILVTANNMVKNIEDFILSTSTDIPAFSTATHRIDHRYLKTPPTVINGNNAPYVSYDIDVLSSNNTTFIVPELNNLPLFIRYYSNDDSLSTQIAELCSAGKNCYYWVVIGNAAESNGFKTLAEVKSIDESFDDGVETTGSIRYFKNNVTNQYNIGFKGPQTLKRY